MVSSGIVAAADSVKLVPLTAVTVVPEVTPEAITAIPTAIAGSNVLLLSAIVTDVLLLTNPFVAV